MVQLAVAICDDERIVASEIYRQLQDINENYDIDIYESGEKLLGSKKDICIKSIELIWRD